MKKLLLSILILLSTFCSHAQFAERLIATSSYTHYSTLKPFDTAIYTYSGIRNIDTSWDNGSQPKAFDAFISWRYNTNYDPYRKWIKKYRPDNKLLTDTLFVWNASIGQYDYGQFDSYTYNSNGLPDLEVSKIWSNTSFNWADFKKISYNYSATGNKIVESTLWWRASASHWDSLFTYYWAYNSSNKLSTYIERDFLSSTGAYSSSSRTRYTYNTVGDVDSIIRDLLMPGYPSPHPETVSVDSFNTDNDLSLQVTQVWDSSGWHYNNRINYIYDSHHNMMQYIQQNYDTSNRIWHNSRLYQASYDNYDMITSFSYSDWDSSGAGSWHTPNYIYRFYYEQYNTTGMNSIPPIIKVKVYPIPACNMLSLDFRNDNVEEAEATIYDSDGKMVDNYPIPTVNDYHGYIPVGTLNQGIYFLVIKTPSGKVTKAFNIVR